MSTRIQYDTTLSSAVTNGICQSQTPGGAGAMTLNGSLVSGGVATLDATSGQVNARQVLFTFAADDSARTFVISGTLTPNGGTVTESVTGSATTSTSVNYFLTVSKITVDAGTAGAVQVGTNGVGASQARALDRKTNPFNVGIGTILKSGSANWTIQHTFDDVFNPSVIPTWLNHSSLASISATTDGNYAFAVMAIRTKINSGTGTVTSEFLQSDRVG